MEHRLPKEEPVADQMYPEDRRRFQGLIEKHGVELVAVV